MSEIYREEEIFWVYENDYPKTRKASSKEARTFIQDSLAKHPTATYKIVREWRIREEVAVFKVTTPKY